MRNKRLPCLDAHLHLLLAPIYGMGIILYVFFRMNSLRESGMFAKATAAKRSLYLIGIFKLFFGFNIL